MTGVNFRFSSLKKLQDNLDALIANYKESNLYNTEYTDENKHVKTIGKSLEYINYKFDILRSRLNKILPLKNELELALARTINYSVKISSARETMKARIAELEVEENELTTMATAVVCAIQQQIAHHRGFASYIWNDQITLDLFALIDNTGRNKLTTDDKAKLIQDLAKYEERTIKATLNNSVKGLEIFRNKKTGMLRVGDEVFYPVKPKQEFCYDVPFWGPEAKREIKSDDFSVPSLMNEIKQEGKGDFWNILYEAPYEENVILQEKDKKFAYNSGWKPEFDNRFEQWLFNRALAKQQLKEYQDYRNTDDGKAKAKLAPASTVINNSEYAPFADKAEANAAGMKIAKAALENWSMFKSEAKIAPMTEQAKKMKEAEEAKQAESTAKVCP